MMGWAAHQTRAVAVGRGRGRARASCGQNRPPREADGLNNFHPQKWVPNAIDFAQILFMQFC